MKFISLCLLAVSTCLAHAQYAGSKPVPKEYRKGFDAIKAADAQKWLGYLAGPECEGRGTLQPGFQKAAKYMAARFKEFGLKPVGDKGSYFQNVHFARTALRPADSMLSSEDGSTRYTQEGEIAFGQLGRATDVTAAPVFLRIGSGDVQIPASADLKNRFVFVTAARFPQSLRNAISAKDPAAIIQIQDDVFQASGSAQRVVSGSLARLSITRNAALKLVSDQGLANDAIDSTAAKEGSVDVYEGKGKLRIRAKFDETDVVDAPNVVGFLPGSDPKFNGQIIGIGAHLDHLGKRGDRVWPGADDDGSGSTAVLAVAKAFHDGATKPKRGILFMAFCGEEMGLIGSGYYSDNPIFPHDGMIAELQMDMVGRDSDGVQNGDRNRVDKRDENIDTMRLVGSKRISTDLHNLILEDNKYLNFKFKYDAEDVYTRSDHYNFARQGIPIAFLFDGFHPDYHQPTDTIDKIDWAKLTNAAKLYYIVALDLANRADRPKKDVAQAGN